MNRFLAITATLLGYNNIISFTLNFQLIYYSVFAVILLTAFGLYRKNLRINYLMIAFYAACVISITLNEIPQFYMPWERFLTFLAVSLLVGPAIYNFGLGRLRLNIFIYSQYASIIVILISAIIYFVGYRGDGSGYYSGITNHSMLLAPICGTGFLFLLHRSINLKARLFKFQRQLYFLLMIIALALLLLSAARGSLIALAVALIFYFIFPARRHSRRVYRYGGFGILILAVTFNFWSNILDEGVIKKNQGTGLNIDSRSEHWQQRLVEFESSPIIGIGFGAVDAEAQVGSTFSDDGKVETGSSWLAILSMLGLIGAFLYIYLIFRSFRAAHTIRKTSILGGYSEYMFSVLIFWSVHMLSEGYMLAGGSFLFFSVWLLIGAIQALSTFPALSAEVEKARF